ncbi:hypothetical protein GCM10025787_54780 [Saccharopolyspora rosea]
MGDLFQGAAQRHGVLRGLPQHRRDRLIERGLVGPGHFGYPLPVSEHQSGVRGAYPEHFLNVVTWSSFLDGSGGRIAHLPFGLVLTAQYRREAARRDRD